MKKLYRRIFKIFKSLPSIVYGLIFETNTHPWIIVCDYLTLSSQGFINKSSKHLEKYFTVSKVTDDKQQIFLMDDLKFMIPTNRINDEHYLYTLLVLYFDIIYSNLTKWPIPILIQEGSYESKDLTINKDDVIFDIGANIGVFTCYAAKKTGSNGKIFSFEPIPELANQVEDSVRANNFSNVTIIESAVGDSVGNIELSYSSEDFGGASQSQINGNQICVPLISIDQFSHENLIKKIDFIKMDIEGMEPEAIRGAKNVISKFKPKLAICTYHDPSHPELLENLIREYNSSYKIKHTAHKIFAW